MERGSRLSPEKRSAILEAAVASFREVGFGATSMDRIAERAGVSKRTVYNHFDSKDELFDAVIADAWTQLAPSDNDTIEQSLPVRERMTSLARKRIDGLLSPKLVGLLRAVIAESVRVPELARAYGRDHGHAEILGFRDLLREEAERGRLQIEDLDLAASQFWALTCESLFWPLVLGLRGPASVAERDRLVREGVATFLARYSAPPADESDEEVSARKTARDKRKAK